MKKTMILFVLTLTATYAQVPNPEDVPQLSQPVSNRGYACFKTEEKKKVQYVNEQGKQFSEKEYGYIKIMHSDLFTELDGDYIGRDKISAELIYGPGDYGQLVTIDLIKPVIAEELPVISEETPIIELARVEELCQTFRTVRTKNWNCTVYKNNQLADASDPENFVIYTRPNEYVKSWYKMRVIAAVHGYDENNELSDYAAYSLYKTSCNYVDEEKKQRLNKIELILKQ